MTIIYLIGKTIIIRILEIKNKLCNVENRFIEFIYVNHYVNICYDYIKLIIYIYILIYLITIIF